MTNNTCFLHIFITTAANAKELLISHEGIDFKNCGYGIPCLTIGYTLENRAISNDIINIDNSFSDGEKTFTINKAYPFKENLTLVGINGMPVISSQSPLVLFDNRGSSNLTLVTLTVINVWFKGVALSLFEKAPGITSITILHCQVSHLFSAENRTSFIHSDNVFPDSRNSSIVIRIHRTNTTQFSTLITLKGLHIGLDITHSSFQNLPANTALFGSCSTLVEMSNVLSLQTDIFSIMVTNTYVFFADLHLDTKKSSVINITDSILDNEFGCNSGFSVSEATLHLKNCTVRGKLNVGHEASTVILFKAKATFENFYFINHRSDGDDSLVDISFGSHATFHSCNFTNNSAVMAIIMTYANSNVTFSDCNFTNNFGHAEPYPGGGTLRITQSVAKFKNCHFKQNGALHNGGAVCLAESPTLFENCHFENNFAKQGGAIYLENVSQLAISNCSFEGNKATVRGSSIWHRGGSISVTSSTFTTSSSSPNYHHHGKTFGGDCIYSSSGVTLHDVSIYDSNNFNTRSTLITSATLFAEMNLEMKCFQGKDIAVHGELDSPPDPAGSMFRMVNVVCISCPLNTYSLYSGKVKFADTTLPGTRELGYNLSHIDCLKCPFGGVCQRGLIRAANGFWGYLKNSKDVHFLNCPHGYCCSEKLCKSYNSCALGRHGTLCSSCDKNLRYNVITSVCVEPRRCLHPWFWLIVIFGGILYFLVFMYMQELVTLLKKFLYPKVMKNMLKRSKMTANEMFPLDDDNVEEGYDSAESLKNGKSDEIFPGLLKIVIFFYQTSALYSVFEISDKLQNSLAIMKEILFTMFNLRTDGLFYQKFLWCPFENLKPISKVLFKTSFILYLLSLVIITYIITRIWKFCKQVSDHYKSMMPRLLPCGMRLILISYATITSSLFSLLLCVPLHPEKKVLFIDGSIKCYQWWQYVTVMVVICWVVPFPFALYTSTWLLHRKKISIRMFVLALTLPLAAILNWLYIQLSVYLHHGTTLDNNFSINERPEEESSWQEKMTNELLNVIVGPFRKVESWTLMVNNHKLPWESILIGRRLILIVIKTFLFNTVIRLYLMLLFTVLFLIHHVKVQPFSNTGLNYVETGSLVMLAAICGLNIIPAYNYMYPVPVSPFSKGLIQTFSKIETALMLIFPAVIGFGLTALVSIRIFYFIFQLCKAFVRIIRSCMNARS